MIGVETQYKLKEFFQTAAEQEIIVERQRQNLARHPDFEPFAAFTRFTAPSCRSRRLWR